jgi:hypothetical protein
VKYWRRLKSLELDAWLEYKPATRRNFRVTMSQYSLLEKGDGGKYRLAHGVTAEGLGVKSSVAAAAETIVTAIDEANLFDEEFKAKYAASLRVLKEFASDARRSEM